MFDFHLRDTSTYERLPRAQANAEEVRIREEIGDWIDTYAGALGKEIVTYLTQRLAKNVDTPFSFVLSSYTRSTKVSLKTRIDCIWQRSASST
ncbi:hypothetical protein THAOC_22926, partial [Thalassiosira oceanica]